MQTKHEYINTKTDEKQAVLYLCIILIILYKISPIILLRYCNLFLVIKHLHAQTYINEKQINKINKK